jgi:hypothetical protein
MDITEINENCKVLGFNLIFWPDLLGWTPLKLIPSLAELKGIKKHQNKNQHGFQLVMKRDKFVFNRRRCEIPKVSKRSSSYSTNSFN